MTPGVCRSQDLLHVQVGRAEVSAARALALHSDHRRAHQELRVLAVTSR